MTILRPMGNASPGQFVRKGHSQFLMGLEMKPRAFCMTGKLSATELQLQPGRFRVSTVSVTHILRSFVGLTERGLGYLQQGLCKRVTDFL